MRVLQIAERIMRRLLEKKVKRRRGIQQGPEKEKEERGNMKKRR